MTANELPHSTTNADLGPKSWQPFLDRIPGLVTVFNISSGKYTFVSKNSQQILGLTATTVKRRGVEYLLSLVHPEDLSHVTSMRQHAQSLADNHRADQNLPTTYMYRIRHVSGQWRRLVTTASVFSSDIHGKPQTILFISQDITQTSTHSDDYYNWQKHFNQRFQALVEQSDVGVVLRDANLHYTYASPAVETVFGYPVNEYLELSLADYMHPDDFAVYKPLIEDMRNTPGMTLSGPIRVFHKDGSLRWVEVTATNLLDDPNIQAVVSNFRDVTEQYQASQALQASQEQLNLTLQASGIGTWDWDIHSDKLVWSERLEQLFGLERGQFKGSFDHFTQLIHPEDIANLTQAFATARQSGDMYSVKHRVIHPDGSIHWILGLGRAILDNQGRAVRMMGIGMDIDQQAELQQRKDEFIAIASHELKTPVTSLRMYGQMLERRIVASGQTEMSTYIKNMNGQIEKLSRLVFELLDATKIDANKLELNYQSFDLCHMISEAIESTALTMPQRRFEFNPCQDITISADRERLSQVLVNLLTNADKFSSDIYPITVEASISSKQATIRVIDHGIGISPRYQKQIFDRFFRAGSDKQPGKYPGLGLGLFISAEIIRRHHGKISVQSQAKQGSTFIITLPLKQKSTDR